MKKKAQIASVAVVLMEPVAVPPRWRTWPRVINSKKSANGIHPSTLQKAIKKKTDQRNGTNLSVFSLRAGRKNSILRNSRMDSKKFFAPVGAELSGREKRRGKIRSI